MEERDDLDERVDALARVLCNQFGVPTTQGNVFAVADKLKHAIQAERERCARMVKEGIRLNKVVVRRTGEQEPYTIFIGDEELADAIRNP